MIRQDGNNNNRRKGPPPSGLSEEGLRAYYNQAPLSGRTNQGRQLSEREKNKRTAQYNPAYVVPGVLAALSYFGNQGGPSQTGTQTVTQKNLPDWAIPDATRTLGFGNYFTNNPDYRPSTLDADFSNVRGTTPEGLPASTVPGAGLTGRPVTEVPPNPVPYDPTDINNQLSVLPPDMQTGGPAMRAPAPFIPPVSNDSRRFKFRPGGAILDPKSNFYENPNYDPTLDPALNPNSATNDSPKFNRPGMGLIPDPNSPGFVNDSQRSIGRTADDEGGGFSIPQITTPKFDFGGGGVQQPGPTTGPAAIPGGTYNPTEGSGNDGSEGVQEFNESFNQPESTSSDNSSSSEEIPVRGSGNEGRPIPEIDPRDIFDPSMMTPFSRYDRQRFAAPNVNVTGAEGILAGRYNERFGPRGVDNNPFQTAEDAVDKAAKYASSFKGTMTGDGLGNTAGGYQAGLRTAQNPGIFSGTNYGQNLPGYTNPNAGMTSQQFGNANQNIQGPVNYQQEKTLQQKMAEFQNPYTQQVVNQTIEDMDRARRMTANQISGDAAKAGAYGGSRAMLAQAENNRNFADRTAAAVGRLRSQGFSDAANLAQQENLQRLGLSASDVQNVRGLDSQGNLQGQRLSASDLQNVRGLQSQGALAAMGQRGQDFRSAMGQTGASDRSAMGYNAGLLSDAMGLDASDLRQRRSIGSNEAQFSELASRGAGALNLQGGTALGDLARFGTADERRRIQDMLAAGQAQQGRSQEDLDFIRSEFDRELDFPSRQIGLRNQAIAPATGSVQTTERPIYGQNPLLSALGTGFGAYSLLYDQ